MHGIIGSVKIVIASQAFKESLSAEDAAEAIAEGVRRVVPDAEMVLLPVADGGDDTLATLLKASGGKLVACQVTGPLGEPVQSAWGVLGDGQTAVVEAARACGLALTPEEGRNVLAATTFGVGQIIKAALDAGHTRIIIGVGGTATCDGGVGMAQALGARFLDAQGNELARGGGALLKLARIDLSTIDSRLRQCQVQVAVDVRNALCGPLGAAVTYGPQKGATPQMAEQLDQALARLDQVARYQLDLRMAHLPGAGAGGGLAFGLAAFLGASLLPGAELVCDAIGLDKALDGADYVITGEGRIDWQTAFDKAPSVVARHAAAKSVPVLGVAGSLGPGHEQLYALGFLDMLGIVRQDTSLQDAIMWAWPLLADVTERVLAAALAKASQ